MSHRTPSVDRRHLLVAGLAAALGAGLSGSCGRSGPNAPPLRVATYRGWTQSYFGDAGVEPPSGRVSYAELGAGNFILEALLSGSVDYAEMSEIPPVFVLQQGTGLRQIAVLHGDVNGQILIAPRASPVRDVSDLKGRRIGYVRATTSHYLLLRALAEKGLAWHEVDAIALSPQDGLAAFRSGRLDAWASLGLFLQIALSEGARIVRTGAGLLSGNYVAVSSAVALADPQRRIAIADYMRREKRTYGWIAKNPDRWAARNAASSGLPSQLFLDQFHRSSAPFQLGPVTDEAVRSQQAVADLMAKNGFIPRSADVASLWDRSFATELG